MNSRTAKAILQEWAFHPLNRVEEAQKVLGLTELAAARDKACTAVYKVRNNRNKTWAEYQEARAVHDKAIAAYNEAEVTCLAGSGEKS